MMHGPAYLPLQITRPPSQVVEEISRSKCDEPVIEESPRACPRTFVESVEADTCGLGPPVVWMGACR